MFTLPPESVKAKQSHHVPVPTGPVPIDPRIRFFARIRKTSSCHVWLGFKDKNGYGYFRIGSLTDGSRRVVLAHRFAYELTKGPIPEGLQLDHLCRNPPCVNPGHLEAVTVRENLYRGIGPTATNRAKTYCLRGHPYNAQNIYFRKQGGRSCRACHRAWYHERKRLVMQ